MGRPKKVRAVLPPIWRVADQQWALIEPVLQAHDPPARKGPARSDPRPILDAVIFRLRTGCQWNWLPREYPNDSTVHRHFQRWVKRGVFDRIWATVQEACEDLGGCGREWQAADAWLGKARLGDDVGPNPTDRAKNGMKRSLLVKADGGPLAIVIAGANVPDAKLLDQTIRAIVLDRPEPEPDYLQHLCLDKGYDNEGGWDACVDHEYEPHIALIRDECPERQKCHKPRRWVVERTLAWFSKLRAILIRWEKKAVNYLGLLKLACALLWFRRYDRLTP